MKLDTLIQDAVMRTAPYPGFRELYRAAYGGALRLLVARLRSNGEIDAVDLRMTRPGHCFGSSDLDLRAQVAPLSAPAYFALSERLSDVLLRNRLWLKVFGLHLGTAEELEINRRLALQPRGREQWSRVLGEGQPAGEAPEDRNAYLWRAMHGYELISRELFTGRLNLHGSRLIYKKSVEIHEAAEERLTTRSMASLDFPASVLEAARDPALRGRVQRVSFADLSRAHALAMAEVSALCEQSCGETPIDAGADPDAGAPERHAGHARSGGRPVPLRNRGFLCVAERIDPERDSGGNSRVQLRVPNPLHRA